MTTEGRRVREEKRRQNDGVIRVGDRATIKVPRVVLRVGYPKSVVDYVPRARELLAPARAAAFPAEKFKSRREGEFDRVVQDFAYWMARADRFGGPERTIHSVEVPEWEGREIVVSAVRTAMTGRYYPPSSTHYHEGDYDYDPGGLAHAKVHCIAQTHTLDVTQHKTLLELVPTMGYSRRILESIRLGGRGLGVEFETDNLEKIRGDYPRAKFITEGL